MSGCRLPSRQGAERWLVAQVRERGSKTFDGEVLAANTTSEVGPEVSMTLSKAFANHFCVPMGAAVSWDSTRCECGGQD